MNNSEKILKSISNLLEKSILTSKDFQKELSDNLKNLSSFLIVSESLINSGRVPSTVKIFIRQKYTVF